jgi:mannose-1-phosphate guanylyltransferase
MSKNFFAIIMAGGIGSRFWPSSTHDFPKQFHDMTGEGISLLQSTFGRLEHFIPSSNIFIVTQIRYQKIILDQLGDKLSPKQVICEPDRRNTAPCILMATLKIYKINPDAKIVICPSDHVIIDEKLFTQDMELALDYADEKKLIIFGIYPDFPATGFGYVAIEKDRINSELKKVTIFTEKPDKETAERFIDAQNYFWNSGIFVWSAAAVLEEFKTHAPILYDLFYQGFDILNTPHEESFISKNYPLAENISVDYALMEKSDNIFLIPARFDWDDLGSWKSIYDRQPKDAMENAVLNCELYVDNASQNFIKTDTNKKVVISGLDDFIIVDTEHVLMIYPMGKNQEVKDISEKALKKFNQEKD